MLNKTISTSFQRSEIDGVEKLLEHPPQDREEKLKVASSLIELPVNFKDDIEIIYNDKQLTIRWHPSKIDPDAEALHKNALLLARKGALTEAIENWEKAAQINPYDPDYFFNLGVAYFELKRFQESIENLTRVLAICPFYIKAHLILGTAFLKIRKFEFAKKHLIKSVRYYKNNALSFLNLGAVHSILREYDNGIRMFNQAIKFSPQDPRAYLGLAKIYATVGEQEKANAYFKKVIELDQKGALANYAKRSIIANKDNLKTTISAGAADAKSGSANVEDFYSEGYRLYLSGDYPNSEIMYKRYLSIKRDDDYVWYALAQSQLRSGKLQESLEAIKEALKIYPKKGLYLKDVAIIFDKLNKPDRVIAALTKAKELDKADSITYSLWGKSLFALGNFDEALIMLEKAIKLNTNNQLAKYFMAETLMKLNATEDALDYLYDLKETKMTSPLKERAKVVFNKLTKGE
ncbi:tetratricopeptide repeat protein [candidate division KSB1 bacterium]|nr:tetratricopeptide repeat protein [candidate division KSB1 bacterium]